MLYKGGGSDELKHTDSFSASVIDTIVAEVQNVPGDDRCVLLLGYEPQMADMFQVRQHFNLPISRLTTLFRTQIPASRAGSMLRIRSASMTSTTPNYYRSWTSR